MTPVADQPRLLESYLAGAAPVLALAPMQDVTDLPFWRLLSRYGGPDIYWTEYLRVHATSSLDPHILASILQNPTGRPAIVQLIGNDIPALVRTAGELARLPVAAVDFNLGCPAPVVYRKCAGGGLLREPAKIDAILGALRDALPPGAGAVKFTVKTRLGFGNAGAFGKLLDIFARHQPDLVTVHGRTVVDMYRTEVRYESIAEAVRRLGCPVLANGNVSSVARAAEVLRTTSARGLMIGRGCIRNPWLFAQIRDHLAGRPQRLPVGREVLAYVEALYQETIPAVDFCERLQVEKMKKYMNFIGEGISETFLHQIRRVSSRADFFRVCSEALSHDTPMPLGGRRHEALAEERQLEA